MEREKMRLTGLVLLAVVVAASSEVVLSTNINVPRLPITNPIINGIQYDFSQLVGKYLKGYDPTNGNRVVETTMFQDGLTTCGTVLLPTGPVNATTICFKFSGEPFQLAWEQIDDRVWIQNRPDAVTLRYVYNYLGGQGQRITDVEIECDPVLKQSEAYIIDFQYNAEHTIFKLRAGAACVPSTPAICQQQRTGFAHIAAPSGNSYLRADIPPNIHGNFNNHTVCLRARFHDLSVSGQELFSTQHCALTFGGERLKYSCVMPGMAQSVSTDISHWVLESWYSLCVTRSSAGSMSLRFSSFNNSVDLHVNPAVVDPNTLKNDDTLFYLGKYIVNSDLDEFRVFFRILSEDEQLAIMTNNFAQYPDLFSDNCLSSYYPFSSWDLRDVQSPSSSLTVIVNGEDVIKGQADLDCGQTPCTYDKNKDSVMNPPKLLTDAYGKEHRSGFDITGKFYVRVLVHRRYIPKMTLTPPFWQGTFFDQTDPYCGAWELKQQVDTCYVELEFKADSYADLTSKCAFQTTTSGPLPKAYGDADDTAVYGQVRLDLQEPFPLACSSSNMIVSKLPECQDEKTLRQTQWRIPFVTFFETRVETPGYTIKIYDQATAVSVIVDQTVTKGTLDLSKKCPVYTALSMTGVVRTFVNWPYKLTLSESDYHGRPASTASGAGTISLLPGSETTCSNQKPVGGVGTCVQEWKVEVLPSDNFMDPDFCGRFSNLDVILTANFTVTAVNGILQNNYYLPKATFSFRSGNLLPIVTEEIKADAQMIVCKYPLTIQGEGSDRTLACIPSGNPNERQTEFVRSPRQTSPAGDRIQIAYFGVVPRPYNPSIGVDWCQLLQVKAYPLSDPYSQIGFTIFKKKENGNVYGLLVDPFNETQAAGSDVWITDPVPMSGQHVDYPGKTGCTFSFPVLSNYFCCGPSRGATTWSIEATIFIKYSGVAVIPQTAAVRKVLAGYVRNGQLHLQAADPSATQGGIAKQVTISNLAISPAPSDAALDEEPTTPPENNPTPTPNPNPNPNPNPTPTPTPTPNPNPNPTETTSESGTVSSSIDAVPLAAGVGGGCLLLGAFVTWLALRSCWKSSKPALAGSQDLPPKVVEMQKHLGGPAPSLAEPQATSAL